MHLSYLQGNSEGVVLHFEHFDIFNYISARTANIFKLRNGVSRVSVPIQQGQSDGKDLLAEEPDWGPAKNLRSKISPFAIACLTSLLFAVQTGTNFSDEMPRVLRHYWIEFFDSSWCRLCGISAIFRGGAVPQILPQSSKPHCQWVLSLKA